MSYNWWMYTESLQSTSNFAKTAGQTGDTWRNGIRM